MDRQQLEQNQKTEERQPAGSHGAEKKKAMGIGICCGALGAVLAGLLLLAVVSRAAGVRILVTNGSTGTGGALLTDGAVAKIEELKAYADLYYYDEIDEDALRDGLYEGVISGLGDKYSVYYNAEDNAQMQLDTTGKYYGIGAGLRQEKDTMMVSISKVYEGTPSEEAGLLADDVILTVDGAEASSMEVTELVKLIRGEEGTSVHLEIYRPSTGEDLSFDVKRANVTLPSISHEMLEGGIGYIHIDSFESETALQFEQALAELEGQDMKALILDVRYNGGGLVTSVVQILDDILPEGLLVYTEDKNGRRQEYFSSDDASLDCPLAVLINGDSASASEILAGAVKDYGYGTLIGTATYGKGIVQSVFQLEDGDAVKLTTAKYFTPKGNYIHEAGIEPDIALEYEYLDPDGTEYEIQYDNQVQKAIEVLTEHAAEGKQK